MLGSQSSMMLSYLKEKSAGTEEQVTSVRNQLKKISDLADSLGNAQSKVEAIGDLVETELLGMDKAIEEAAGRIHVCFSLFLKSIFVTNK